ncbi:MAG: transcriptional regulator NrdR [Spirulinaceae cyanobacterium]
MQCPSCQHTDSRVLESRSTERGQSVRRRRECLLCKNRFTTYERIEFVPITVHKRDGSKESFARSKLLRGIVRACEKTVVTHQQIEELVDDLETQIQQRSGREIASYEIGELVLKYLSQENEVAYVRFASVYRQFQGIKDFVETLNQLKNEANDTSESWHSTSSETANSDLSNSMMTSS